MTAGEQANLNTLAKFIHDWREEDKSWKQDVSDRLKALEEDRVAREAVRAHREHNRSNNLWRIVMIASFISTTAAGITVASLKFLLHL